MVKEFSNGPGTKSFVPQGEGERFARGRKGRSLFDKDVVEEVDQPVPEGDGGEEKEMVKELS